MKVYDIVEFDKKRYFGGAIQANWFYEKAKVKDITMSYVFHGPKCHGVDANNFGDNRYSLYDTASYALELIERDETKNDFMLTIAGYGTGKSHLAVTLASLLFGHDASLRNEALERIKSVDTDIHKQISSYVKRILLLC